MYSIQETLASWATILGTALSVFGLIQSRAWLTGISVLLVGISIAAGLYARRERLANNSASVNVEGQSIDALNMANVRRRLNRSLAIQEVNHEARIEGEDLSFAWRYSGYCRSDQETAIEFSIDSASAVPFDSLECFGYDLIRDPRKHHPIHPLLIGPDGISKKVAVPFLKPLAAQQPFDMALECRLPGCMRARVGYYTSTLSFDQETVGVCTVRLVFLGQGPKWVRVYDCPRSGPPRLINDLALLRHDASISVYEDRNQDLEAQSARTYMFNRS